MKITKPTNCKGLLKMKKTKLCDELNIKYPIIQAGMVWVSGAKLAAASANAGCLGVIGAGSMKPKRLEQQIVKALELTASPLAVNIPIMYKDAKEQIDVALRLGIKIFITSAGSPKKYTQYLKEKNCYVIHVTSNIQLALKCQQANVDAVILEGFEAGGHNGRDELTSLVLLQEAYQKLDIPVIAAGGFASGASIVSALVLGAQAVQMGTRFMLTQESRAHLKYKNYLKESYLPSTQLMMKSVVPVRLVKNKFSDQIHEMERRCASKEELVEYLGRGRAKIGMHDGDLEEGELEAGQVSSLINDIPTVEELVKKLILEYDQAIKSLC